MGRGYGPYADQQTLLTAAAVTATALAAPSAASAAEQLAAVTNSNKVLTFASDSPGNLDTAYPLTGLASGEKIVGLDTRPATGQLYGLGKTGRIYVIDAASGATRSVAGPISPLPAGSTYGFNFNPTVDRIRITTDQRQNLRVNPDTGDTVVDTPLAYAAGQGGGVAPQVGGVAYTNPVPTATTTQLFDLEAARDALTTQTPANSGTLTTVGNGLGPGHRRPLGLRHQHQQHRLGVVQAGRPGLGQPVQAQPDRRHGGQRRVAAGHRHACRGRRHGGHRHPGRRGRRQDGPEDGGRLADQRQPREPVQRQVLPGHRQPERGRARSRWTCAWARPWSPRARPRSTPGPAPPGSGSRPRARARPR